jgi:hypothetical protein
MQAGMQADMGIQSAAKFQRGISHSFGMAFRLQPL